MKTSRDGPRAWHLLGAVAGAGAGLGLGLFPQDDRSPLFYVIIGILIVSVSALSGWAAHEERVGHGWWSSKSRSRGNDDSDAPHVSPRS
jgi:hypothetical protein